MIYAYSIMMIDVMIDVMIDGMLDDMMIDDDRWYAYSIPSGKR